MDIIVVNNASEDRTPWARLLASEAIPVAMKDRLRAVLGTVDRSDCWTRFEWFSITLPA